MEIDLDEIAQIQPTEGYYCGHFLIDLDNITGKGLAKWDAADDLLCTIQVQIERLRILEEKAQALCSKYAGE